MKKLFHVMKGSQRVVILAMDREGNYTVYCPGSGGGDDAWPHYSSSIRQHLGVWFDDHAGQVISSPFSEAEFQPGTTKYPRALANALTYDSLLGLWAYVTTPNILVSPTQIARALGIKAQMVTEQLGQVGAKLNGDAPRNVGINTVKQVFGVETADRLVLFSGQIANFLGVYSESVPGIVERLGIGVLGRSRVGVLWGTLRRVRRTGPRSFEVRDV
jgi:hypothetical protein